MMDFVKKNIDKVKNSDFIKNEKRDLKSLRVRLVYFTFILWAYIVYKMPVENLKDILVQVTFILSVLVLVYVLGKKNIKLDMGPLKLELLEVEKTEEAGKNDGHSNTGINNQ